MSGWRLGLAVARIAAATSIIRTRTEDALRVEHRGGSSNELCQRVEVVVQRLEQTAQELEDLIA